MTHLESHGGTSSAHAHLTFAYRDVDGTAFDAFLREGFHLGASRSAYSAVGY